MEITKVKKISYWQVSLSMAVWMPHMKLLKKVRILMRIYWQNPLKAWMKNLGTGILKILITGVGVVKNIRS